MDPVTSLVSGHIAGKLFDLVGSQFYKQVIERWSKRRADIYFKEFCRAVEVELTGIKSEELDKKLNQIFMDETRTEVLFVGDACLVMGSERKLQDHISRKIPEQKFKANLKKIRLGDILRAIKHGDKIVFDEESFNRFYPLGKQIGFELDDPSLDANENSDSNFYLVSNDGLITTESS